MSTACIMATYFILLKSVELELRLYETSPAYPKPRTAPMITRVKPRTRRYLNQTKYKLLLYNIIIKYHTGKKKMSISVLICIEFY